MSGGETLFSSGAEFHTTPSPEAQGRSDDRFDSEAVCVCVCVCVINMGQSETGSQQHNVFLIFGCCTFRRRCVIIFLKNIPTEEER